MPEGSRLSRYGLWIGGAALAATLIWLVEARRRARAERSRLDAVTESTSIMLIQAGRDFRYRFINRAGVEFLGLPREAIVGRRIPDVVGERAFEAIRPFVERVLRGEVVEYEIEVPYERLGPRTVQVRYVPDRAESGDVVGWFASVADVTELARAAEALRIADRRKDELLSTLAHELRNPLAPMRHAAQVLRTTSDPTELAWSREVVDRQVERMARLLDDLLDGAAPPSAAEASPRVEGLAAPMPSPRRVVVVDDNHDSADSLTMLLRLEGHDVQTAYDGERALAAVAAHDPDVVLLDLGIPKIDGFEVCRRLRAEPGGERRVVVALTGWSQELHRSGSHDAGFDHHLVKPVDLDMLAEIVRGS